MLVIVGLIVFLVAGLVAIVGMQGNAGADHPPTENFDVFGYHPTGSTGTLFLLRIVVGVVASLGVTGLFVGAQRSASRAADARRPIPTPKGVCQPRPRHPARTPTTSGRIRNGHLR